jgi:hypothetical protein
VLRFVFSSLTLLEVFFGGTFIDRGNRHFAHMFWQL